MRERETKAEINTAPATTIPNSLKSLPTKPSRKIIGRKTIASVSEVEMTAKKISLDPSLAAVHLSMPCSIFLYIFSVTTIPSSTTSPVASTSDKRVSTLIEKPAMYMIKNAPTNATGISISGLNAIDHSLKNK